MVKFIIAKQLVGKKVISVSGFDVGRFIDADVNEITGKINYILVEPNMDSSISSKLDAQDGHVKIPYNSVTAVADYRMVDLKGL